VIAGSFAGEKDVIAYPYSKPAHAGSASQIAAHSVLLVLIRVYPTGAAPTHALE